MVLVNRLAQIPQTLQNLNLIVARLRCNDHLCATADCRIQCQITAVIAHDLDNRAAMMRTRRITQLIDALHARLQRRIKSDCKIRTRNIVIDRTRQTNAVDALLRHRHSTAIRTITADDNQRINAGLTHMVHALILNTFFLELRKTGRSQQRTAAAQ